MFSLQNSQAMLIEQIQKQVDTTRFEWLQSMLNELSGSTDPIAELGLYSAMSRRKLGDDRITSPSENSLTDYSVKPVQMRISDAARLVMLMQILAPDSSQWQEIITAYFKMGDEQEHIALLRGLSLLKPANYLVEIALDCGRSNNLEVLAALMHDNPFPALHYTPPAFNQMVLKALFLGLNIELITGLSTLANDDLSRMCESYVVEREEAQREVPADIWLALAPCASAAGKEQLQRYLSHPNRNHRYYCCLALLQRLPSDSTTLPLLQQHLKDEKDVQIKSLLQLHLPISR